jgi:hypothetical protein
MKIQKEWAEMVADKIRGYHTHKSTGLVGITFRGDWVMHNNGFLVRTSFGEWSVSQHEIDTRSEDLEKRVANIAEFTNHTAMVGVDGEKLFLVNWYETEWEARKVANLFERKKIWDCNEKRYV